MKFVRSIHIEERPPTGIRVDIISDSDQPILTMIYIIKEDKDAKKSLAQAKKLILDALDSLAND